MSHKLRILFFSLFACAAMRNFYDVLTSDRVVASRTKNLHLESYSAQTPEIFCRFSLMTCSI